MEDVKIVQRGIVRFLTLEGVAPKRILKRLQKVYQEEALNSSQVECWATETNDRRGRCHPDLKLITLFRSAYVIYLFICAICRYLTI